MVIKIKTTLRLLCTAIVSFFLVNVVNIALTPTGSQVTLNLGQKMTVPCLEMSTLLKN